jgi:hypothetical protein
MPLHSENAIASGSPKGAEVVKRSIGASTQSKTLVEPRERKGFTVFNHSTAALYLDFGSSVSVHDFAVKIPAGGYYEPPFVTFAEIRGIWEQGQGKALIREFI